MVCAASNEPMLKVAREKATIKTKETVRPEEFKRIQINAREQAWKENVDKSIDKDKTW